MLNTDKLKCPCGCGMTVKQGTIDAHNRLAGVLGANAVVSSGARCVNYNNKIGGSKNSQHLYGLAIDDGFQKPDGSYIDTRKVSCIADISGWFNGMARIDSANKFMHGDNGNRSVKYLGDEIKGYNTVTNNLQKYYGFSNSELVKILTIPNINITNGTSNKILCMSTQLALKIKGFYAEAIDGLFGSMSLAALIAFQKSIGLHGDGIMEVGKTTSRNLFS